MPKKTALYSLERNLTFKQVHDESNQVANGLQNLGVRFGETIAILCHDQPEWVTAFFGILKVGAIVAGLNTQMTSEDLDYILQDCRARVLIIHDTLWETLAPIVPSQPFLKQIIVVGEQKSGR